MADWRQIQARIRKARNGPEPSARLAELYEKTRDAMVAFELAKMEEKAGQNDAAVRWYTTAAERFRRAEWKKKAEEALARLGGTPSPVVSESEDVIQTAAPVAFVESEEPEVTEQEPASQQAAIGSPAADANVTTPAEATPSSGEAAARRRRRRGRRGGRGRRRGKSAGEAQTAPAARAAAPKPAATRVSSVAPESMESELEPPLSASAEPEAPPSAMRRQTFGRAGEPALASRVARLEANLRRLLASEPYRLDDAEQAPAGPGAYLLSDSDLTTTYYAESCKTLRIALAQLARGRTQHGTQRGSSLRARMAEHLGITETRVTKYLKDHCVVRWLQLDEGALHLAHFTIAVLQPTLNEEED